MFEPRYLQPYLDAARRHGGGFQSLLWASPKTQMARFEAIARLGSFHDRSMIDAGCGRADLLDFLLDHGITPRKYIGLEAVDAMADAADAKAHPIATILRGDFIRQPTLFDGNADSIVFSGSLNTLGNAQFYEALETAWKSTAGEVVFNFLCSPLLASGKHLTWHRPGDVLNFVASHSRNYKMLDDYLDGDCTMVMRKET